MSARLCRYSIPLHRRTFHREKNVGWAGLVEGQPEATLDAALATMTIAL
jgi:hypothetical protein